MGQQIKGLATKPDHPSSIPGTDLVAGKNLILASYIQTPPHANKYMQFLKLNPSHFNSLNKNVQYVSSHSPSTSLM